MYDKINSNNANYLDIIKMSQKLAPIYSYKNPRIYHQNLKNWNFDVHSNFHSNLNRPSRLYLKSYVDSTGGDETRSGYVQYVEAILPNVPERTTFIDIYNPWTSVMENIPRYVQR